MGWDLKKFASSLVPLMGCKRCINTMFVYSFFCNIVLFCIAVDVYEIFVMKWLILSTSAPDALIIQY